MARAMPRGSYGLAGPRVKSSPRSPQAAYPTPRLPSGLPCTSQPTYPAPPNQPTLHPPRAGRQTTVGGLCRAKSPAPRLPTGLPYTRRAPDTRRHAVGGPHRAKSPGLPTDLPYTAPRPRENDQVAIPQQPHPRVLPVRLASCVAGGLSLGNLGEEGLTLSRS